MAVIYEGAPPLSAEEKHRNKQRLAFEKDFKIKDFISTSYGSKNFGFVKLWANQKLQGKHFSSDLLKSGTQLHDDITTFITHEGRRMGFEFYQQLHWAGYEFVSDNWQAFLPLSSIANKTLKLLMDNKYLPSCCGGMKIRGNGWSGQTLISRLFDVRFFVDVGTMIEVLDYLQPDIVLTMNEILTHGILLDQNYAVAKYVVSQLDECGINKDPLRKHFVNWINHCESDVDKPLMQLCLKYGDVGAADITAKRALMRYLDLKDMTPLMLMNELPIEAELQRKMCLTLMSE